MQFNFTALFAAIIKPFKRKKPITKNTYKFWFKTISVICCLVLLSIIFSTLNNVESKEYSISIDTYGDCISDALLFVDIQEHRGKNENTLMQNKNSLLRPGLSVEGWIYLNKSEIPAISYYDNKIPDSIKSTLSAMNGLKAQSVNQDIPESIHYIMNSDSVSALASITLSRNIPTPIFPFFKINTSGDVDKLLFTDTDNHTFIYPSTHNDKNLLATNFLIGGYMDDPKFKITAAQSINEERTDFGYKFTRPYDVSKSLIKINLDQSHNSRIDFNEHIKSLSFHSNTPVKISGLYPEPDSFFVDGFVYNDPQKIKDLQARDVSFFCEYPEFEGIQNSRNFLLTTILSLLILQFFQIVYSFARPVINGLYANRLKQFKNVYVITITVIVILTVILGIHISSL